MSGRYNYIRFPEDEQKFVKPQTDDSQREIPSYLLNCPFCGEPATIEEIPAHTHMLTFIPDHPGSFTIECNSCCCGIIGHDKERLITHWNKRDNTFCGHCKEDLAEDQNGVFVKHEDLIEVKEVALTIFIIRRNYVWI